MQIAYGTFLDIEGDVNHSTITYICDAARTHRIDQAILILIESMLDNCSIATEMAGQSLTASTSRGCVQEDALSQLH